MKRDEYATGADDLILILRFNAARTGRSAGVGAQYREDGATGFFAWCGCVLLSVNGATCIVKIANGDTFTVGTHNVRIPLAS